MGIFIKRPLCLFCFSFIGASVLACAFDGRYNLFAFFGALLIASFFFALSFFVKKRKYGLLEAAIALLFVALAFISFYLSITLEKSRAQEYCGEDKTVQFLVLDEEYVSRYSSKYIGRVISVNGEETDMPAKLICEYEGDYLIGDIVLNFGNIEMTKSDDDGSIFVLPNDITLSFFSTIDEALARNRQCEGFVLRVLCARLRAFVSKVFLERLDYRSAALSIGLLSGDKSFIDAKIIRDFRRSGISHILAVSGLHLSLVIGAAELLLRRIYVKKTARCIILSLLSFLLLMLSGFSASACRSVIMLMCVYFTYMLFRESDALTSLGIAGFLIILVSPKSIGDIGFWLSFFATFGLVSWLSLFDVTKRAERTKRLLKCVRYVLKKIGVGLATTFCATISILFITWIFFGEVSVIGFVTNLIITPLCEVYLILSILIFLFGAIPYLSAALASCARFLCGIITSLSSFFSSLDGAVVSLRYPFAAVIIIIMSLLLLVLLVVKLKRKKLILAVPFAALACFCICISVFNYTSTGVKISYVNNQSRDSLVLVEKNSALLFDVSDGAYASFYDSILASDESYATEIGAVVLTHYHTKYISSLDNICRNEMVRRIYVPMTYQEDEKGIVDSIARQARENGVAFIAYQYGETIHINEDISFLVRTPDKCGYSTRKIINFSVFYKDKVLYYADSSWEHGADADAVAKSIEACDAVILGAHGPERKKNNEKYASLLYPEVLFLGAKNEEKRVCRFQIN